jgi:hypothetical protein
MDLHTDVQEEDTISSFECNCENEKKYRLTFDGGDSGYYLVEYCQKCFDLDDKQFMLSTEVLL